MNTTVGYYNLNEMWRCLEVEFCQIKKRSKNYVIEKGLEFLEGSL